MPLILGTSGNPTIKGRKRKHLTHNKHETKSAGGFLIETSNETSNFQRSRHICSLRGLASEDDVYFIGSTAGDFNGHTHLGGSYDAFIGKVDSAGGSCKHKGQS